MDRYTGIVMGAVITCLGVAGVILWPHAFITVVKGVLPPLLILGGAIAVAAGVSEIKDEEAAKREEKK